MVVLVVLLSLAAVAVCCTGVGILVCCIAWLKRSESVWTKAEREDIELAKTERKKGELHVGHLMTKAELHKQIGFTNLTAYEIPVSTTGITSRGPTANSVEIVQNEAYIDTRCLAHIQEDNSQVADIKSTSYTEIKAVQNVAYKPTNSHTTEPTHAYGTSSGSVDESLYTYISSEQANSAAMNMASNVAYIRSHHRPLDVIYEETRPDGGISRDRTQAGHNRDYNLNVHAHTKSETTL